MREIKFRALNPETNEYHYADIFETDEMEEWTTWEYPKDHGGLNTGVSWDREQFTGLTDKNGVDIYEGDIVKFHSRFDSSIGVVEYRSDETHFAFNLIPDSRDDYRPIGHGWYCCEVIGNIHENTELLK